MSVTYYIKCDRCGERKDLTAGSDLPADWSTGLLGGLNLCPRCTKALNEIEEAFISNTHKVTIEAEKHLAEA